jgi:hypothetical protein
MTPAGGSFVRLGVLTMLISAVVPAALARAQLELSTATVPRYGNGTIKCSAVNVGPNSLDMTVSLIDVSTGDEETNTTCTGDGSTSDSPAVPSGQRCVADSTTEAILFCKILVDIKGGSGTPPNPAVALLRQQVRANITAISSDNNSFIVQAAE